MQSSELAYEAKEKEFSYTSHPGSRTTQIRSIQTERGDDPCFLTNKRLLCKDGACEWRKECRRLVAIWKR